MSAHAAAIAGAADGRWRAASVAVAAFAYTLIETAKLNDFDPRAWLADGAEFIYRAAQPTGCTGELWLDCGG